MLIEKRYSPELAAELVNNGYIDGKTMEIYYNQSGFYTMRTTIMHDIFLHKTDNTYIYSLVSDGRLIEGNIISVVGLANYLIRESGKIELVIIKEDVPTAEWEV